MFPEPSPKVILYIAGPYTATEELPSVAHNIHYAWERAFHYIQKGYGVICPHANTFHMDAAADYEFFSEMTAELLRRCDALVLIKGWKNSPGARNEHRIACHLQLPILYEDGYS